MEVGALELGNSCVLGALRNVGQGGSGPKRYCQSDGGAATKDGAPTLGSAYT